VISAALTPISSELRRVEEPHHHVAAFSVGPEEVLMPPAANHCGPMGIPLGPPRPSSCPLLDRRRQVVGEGIGVGHVVRPQRRRERHRHEHEEQGAEAEGHLVALSRRSPSR